MSNDSADQQSSIESLQKSTQDLRNFFKGVDAKTVLSKPSPHMWSMAECLEHILIIDKAVKNVFNGPCLDVDRDPGQKIAKIERDFLNFEKKYDAPGIISPKGNTEDIESMLRTIEDLRSDIINSKNLHIECQAFRHALFGHLTKLEWIWFVIIHTERHIQQLNRIKNMIGA